jgi:hypothetical protein
MHQGETSNAEQNFICIGQKDSAIPLVSYHITMLSSLTKRSALNKYIPK